MRAIAGKLYAVTAWLFVLGVLVQVFLAGLVVVARAVSWEVHTGLGHGLALPLIVMLIAMYVGRLSGSTKRLTWILFGVYVLQADVLIFLRASLPYAAALHPVLALIDFALGWRLARAGTREASAVDHGAKAQPELAGADG